MKTHHYFISLLIIFAFGGLFGCNQEAENTSTTTNNVVAVNAPTDTKQKAANQTNAANSSNATPTASKAQRSIPSNSPAQKDQVVFKKHTNVDGVKAKIGDFLSMHLMYATAYDSVIYSTYKNNSKPTAFRMQKALFKGLLNNGLAKMAAGDSATFYVPTDSLYTSGKMPRFTQSGEFIKYTVALKKIQSPDAYLQQEQSIAKEQYSVDDALIQAYLKKYNLKADKTTDGVYYVVSESGKIKIPKKAKKVRINYTLQTLELERVLESSNDQMKKLLISGQVRGFQEAIYNFHKGGKGKIIIPSRLGHGKNTRGTIPANSILIYDFEVGDFE